MVNTKKSRLIVFIGKPGAGKSTLIKACFPAIKHTDVLPFVMKYKKDNLLQENKTLLAYRKMYENLIAELTHKHDMILEIGTNHAEFNIKNLKKIAKEFNVIIFLCLASIENCRKRVIKRGGWLGEEALEIRLARNFPESHIMLLEKAGLPYYELDMNKPLKTSIINVHVVIPEAEGYPGSRSA
jgi:predicted kinase